VRPAVSVPGIRVTDGGAAQAEVRGRGAGGAGVADAAEATEQRTCFKCGNVPVKETVILCDSYRHFLTGQTAREIYAALPH
jgi:hypothetical protein